MRIPKAMLPVRDRPILEHTLIHLRNFGVDDVTIAVGHLASQIEDYFGGGEDLDMRISYLREDWPLGTAGAVACLPQFDAPVFVVNGDVLTDLDLSELAAKHRLHGAAATLATKLMQTDLTLGVIDTGSNDEVTGYREKPRLSHRFGLGIYVIDPCVKAYIRPNERVDMPELITALISAGKSVVAYDHSGQWLDIGTPEEYARAAEASCMVSHASS